MSSLFDNIRKVYKIQVICTNCDELTEANIPKGMLVVDFLKDKGRCNNCGTISLRRYFGNKPEKKIL